MRSWDGAQRSYMAGVYDAVMTSHAGLLVLAGEMGMWLHLVRCTGLLTDGQAVPLKSVGFGFLARALAFAFKCPIHYPLSHDSLEPGARNGRVSWI